MVIHTDNQVSLGHSLSSAQYQVAYKTGVAGTVLAFQNAPVALTNQLVNLQAGPGNIFTFSMDRAYNGTYAAIVSGNSTSNIFQVVTGTATQNLTANNLDTVTREIRRLYSLGYY